MGSQQIKPLLVMNINKKLKEDFIIAAKALRYQSQMAIITETNNGPRTRNFLQKAARRFEDRARRIPL